MKLSHYVRQNVRCVEDSLQSCAMIATAKSNFALNQVIASVKGFFVLPEQQCNTGKGCCSNASSEATVTWRCLPRIAA